jgi:primosomal protein N' (replication factor Y)
LCARVSLLIPTHALPPLSYRIPERLGASVRVGTAVVAPLSGRQRLGIVVGTEDESDRASESVVSVVPDLSLQPALVQLCRWIHANAAIPLPAVLRAALPPGIEAGRYRVIEPSPGWPWDVDSSVTRAALERTLGPDGLRAAQAEGRIVLVPSAPQPATVEWTVIRAAAEPDLTRAPRQRDLFETLKERGGASTTAALLSETGASRNSLRELVRRGAARLVRRQESAPMLPTLGDPKRLAPYLRTARHAVKGGGPFLWRTTGREEHAAVAAIVRATLEEGRQALVLAPEVGSVERLVDLLRRPWPGRRLRGCPQRRRGRRGRDKDGGPARNGAAWFDLRRRRAKQRTQGRARSRRPSRARARRGAGTRPPRPDGGILSVASSIAQALRRRGPQARAHTRASYCP